MNFKSPIIISLLVIVVLGIAGALFLTDYWRMISLLILAVGLIILIKFTIGKRPSGLPPSDTPAGGMTETL